MVALQIAVCNASPGFHHQKVWKPSTRLWEEKSWGWAATLNLMNIYDFSFFDFHHKDHNMRLASRF